MEKQTCVDVILLEMTLLEHMNSGHVDKILEYLDDDFLGITYEGLIFKSKEKYAEILKNNKVVVTKETFDCQFISSDSVKLSYLAKTDYSHKVLKHISTWRMVDHQLKMTAHESEEIK